MVQISNTMCSVLGSIDLQDDPPLASIARATRLKTSTCQYTLASLIERKIVVRRARIDFFRLGFMDIAIFVALHSGSRAARNKFESMISENEKVSWLGRSAGEFQYAIVILVRSLDEVQEFLGELSGFPQVVLGTRILAPRLSFTQFNRKYLARGKRELTVLEFRVVDKFHTPDEVDHEILKHLGGAPFESMRKLAKDLGMPFSTVERRIKRLREQGIIRGIYFDINPLELGMLPFRYLISIRCGHVEARKKLARFSRSHKGATYLTEALGSWEFEIGAEMTSSTEALDFAGELSELLSEHGAAFKTLQEGEDLKWTFYPFKHYPFARSL